MTTVVLAGGYGGFGSATAALLVTREHVEDVVPARRPPVHRQPATGGRPVAEPHAV